MSYCRWSSDNFKCDVYLYHHCNGYYALHVAARRHIKELPKFPDINLPSKKFIKEYKKWQKIFDNTPLERIGLPFDGEDYQIRNLKDVLIKLEELKTVGYHIPDWVFEDIKEDLKNEII